MPLSDSELIHADWVELKGYGRMMGKNNGDRRQKILDAVRRFNKRHFNPLMLRMAGSNHSPFAVIYHIGRWSGKVYKTPLLAMPNGDCFVFALTYGPKVDWYRNILVAGRCTLLRRGRIYHLEEPETLEPENGLQSFPRMIRYMLRFNKINHFFRMKIISGQTEKLDNNK